MRVTREHISGSARFHCIEKKKKNKEIAWLVKVLLEPPVLRKKQSLKHLLMIWLSSRLAHSGALTHMLEPQKKHHTHLSLCGNV